MQKKLLVFAAAVLFLAGSVAYAQVTATGMMEGRVVDAQGAPLPGVSIEATSPRMVGSSTAVTDVNGNYRLFSLPSGTFTVVYALPGFKTLKREGIIVQLNQTLTLNITLEQAMQEEEVTVVGQSPLIDVKSTVKGQVMTKEVFMSLPRSRNFDGLLSTVPGVQSESVTNGISVDGATGTENMFYVDGASTSDVHLGTSGQGVVMEIAEEVKISASGYNAEFGGSMGGVVNVITRSGGNAFHGDFIAYYNDNSRWMQGKSRDYIRWDPYDDYTYEYVNSDDLYYSGGEDRDAYHRSEGVINLGGYILKDKIWFFASVNPQYSNQKAMRYFASEGTSPKTYYPYYQKWYTWNGSFKLTAAPIKGLRISGSFVNNFSKYRGTIPSINGTSSATGVYKPQGFDYPNWSAAIQADYSAGNNLLISARGGYHYQNMNNQQVANRFTTYYFNTGNTIEPFISDPFFVANPDMLHVAGWGNYSGSRSLIDREKRMKFSGNLDANYYMNLSGEHAWKAGIQWTRDAEDYFNAALYPMVNVYWGQQYDNVILPEPAAGTYGYYIIRSGFTSPYGYAWDIHRDSWALYLQDSWTINRKLTINAGVRAESEYIPSFNSEYNIKPIKYDFLDKLAPRLGIVYDVFGDSSLKVFGSFGIYYDVMKLYMAEGAYGGFKWKSDYYGIEDPNFLLIANNGDITDAANQLANNRYIGTIDWRIPSFDTTDPDMKPVSQREISFGAEKKLLEDLSVSVRLVNKHLIRTIEDIGVVTSLGELYYQSNPGSAYIQELTQQMREASGLNFPDQPKATREYYAMNLSLEKRFSNNWQGGVNYTLSRVAGNYGGLSSTDEYDLRSSSNTGRNSPNVERYFDLWYIMRDMSMNNLTGPLPQDRTHYIKAYGSYVFPFGLTVGVVGYARSGLPMSTKIQINGVDIYPYGRGDMGRLPWTAWADLYAEYTVKIKEKYTASINLQVNNITNTRTIQGVDQWYNRASFAVTDEELLTGTYDWKTYIDTAEGDPAWKNTAYNKWTFRFGTWTTRLGFRLSF